MARFAAILGLVVILAGALHWWKPFVTQQRLVVASTPSPGASGVPFDLPLKAGSRACVGPADIDPASQLGQLTLSARKPQRANLVFEATAPGYRSQRALQVAIGRLPKAFELPVDPPPHNVVGSYCLRNAGRAPIAIAGTNNPVWIGLARTSIDGRALPTQAIALNVFEARPQSILDRLGTIVRRASDFTGGLMPFWLAWLLTVGLVVGTPLAVFAAFWTTLRPNEPE